jgi:hypothetical protein
MRYAHASHRLLNRTALVFQKKEREMGGAKKVLF